MAIEFEVKLPDEPFKETYELGKTVKVSYAGPRFIVISVCSNTKQVHTFEGLYDSAAEANLGDYNQDGKEFYLMDAQKHPLEACFITNFYTNEKVDDYEETLPCESKWVYQYDASGVLGNIFANVMPTYDSEKDEFSSLELLKPAFSKEEFLEIHQGRIKELESDLAAFKPVEENENITPEDEEKIFAPKREYLEWLKSVETVYAEVDHWKIPYKSPPA